MSRTIQSKEYAKIIKRLREARTETSLRQIDVAKKLKRPQSYVSRIESGEYRVDVLEVKKLAKIYKKNINYFLS